jgi:hypothetical protein
MNFAYVFSVIFFLTGSPYIFAQDAKKISLKNQKLLCDPLNFHVKKVVDGRKVKSTIGVVQKGLSNKPVVADFENPIEDEIMDLISPLESKVGVVNVVIRIDQLEISEVTMVRKEYAAARMTFDFFLALDDSLYYIERKHSYYRSQGIDVTHQHDSNIAFAIEKIIQDFNKLNVETVVIEEKAIAWIDLVSFQPKAIPEPEILNGVYPDAVYTSFEEFRDNDPQVLTGFEIEDENKISLHWIDELGKRIRIYIPIYAVAHKGKLYKYYNDNFYQVENRGNKLIFLGNAERNPGEVMRNSAWGGVLIGSATASKISMTYEIDLNTGEVKERGYAKK